ncbi:MAG: hypothetical protein R3B48_06215 [Kofleriaceae bacterium]
MTSRARATLPCCFAASLGLALASGQPALAWEAETTHVGLAEEAALASSLHKRLTELGFSGGLFEVLAVPPADAPELLAALRRLSPATGVVPDARGRMTALSWLAAGAAVADAPVQFAVHHFFDPSSGKGWEAPPQSRLAALWRKMRKVAPLPPRGIPAPDWLVDPQNPLGLEGFWAQYAKAITAATPGERSRHMAAALVAAGAALHVLGDVGTPSHARADAAEYYEPLTEDGLVLGSRFDRVAALAFDRLGVPGPNRVVTRASVRAFFTSPEGDGLADLISSRYFSAGTLPSSTNVAGAGAAPRLARPQPGVPAHLNLMAAAREGATLKSDQGVCLARYRIERNELEFYLDDACRLEQAQAILPEVAAFETGLLEFLMRGRLTLRQEGGALVVSAGQKLAAGQLEILVEDARGQRTSLKAQELAGGEAGAELARLGTPPGAKILALFRGKDGAGEAIVAVGAVVPE